MDASPPDTLLSGVSLTAPITSVLNLALGFSLVVNSLLLWRVRGVVRVI